MFTLFDSCLTGKCYKISDSPYEDISCATWGHAFSYQTLYNVVPIFKITYLNISFKRGNVISHQRAHYAPLQVKLAERAFLWHIVSKRFAAVHLIGCCIVSFPPSHLSLRKNDYLAAFTPENGYIGDFSPTESLLYSGISPHFIASLSPRDA